MQEAGSYRDPKGTIWYHDNRVFRSLFGDGVDDYQAFIESGLARKKFHHGRLIETQEISSPDDSLIKAGKASTGKNADLLLEHERVPFISYPYEWSYAQLKDAALFHLELLKKALDHNLMMSDASAYNIQFMGAEPVFIDILSFRPYKDGEIWQGYRQFCEQFLNPLLLYNSADILFHPWYRGTFEGIPATDLIKVLPWHKRFNPKMASHVWLQAKLQRTADTGQIQSLAHKENRRKLPKKHLQAMVRDLYDWITGFKDVDNTDSVWHDYEKNNIYDSDEQQQKTDFIARSVKGLTPTVVWDIGCNSGYYSEQALMAGAQSVIGADYDPRTVGLAYTRAKEKTLNLTTICQDLVNPSPAQGWHLKERKSLFDRCNGDMVIALALIHHIVIGRNIPISMFIDWLISLAPTGVVEFVPKEDPMVQTLLQNREDIFPDYHQDHFQTLLSNHADILDQAVVTKSGRILYQYKRRLV